MAITLADAKQQLNIPETDTTDDVELLFFVDTANEWIEAEVSAPTSFRAQLATRLLVAHWWETQRGPAGDSIEDETSSARGSWYTIPNKVKELLPEKHAASSTPLGSFPEAVAWPDSVEYQG